MSPYISGECCVPETSGEVHLMGECVPFRREYCNSYMYTCTWDRPVLVFMKGGGPQRIARQF